MARDAVSELITLAYEGLDDPAAHQALAQGLTRVMSGSLADLELRNRNTLAHEGALARMLPESAAAAYYAHYVALDPLAPKVVARPMGSIVESDTLMARSELERTAFYEEWMMPHEMTRFVAAAVPVSEDVFLAAAVQRGDARGFVQAEVETFSHVVGHLERALRTRVERPGDDAPTDERALFVIDADGRLVRSNAAARAVLDAGRAATEARGCLTIAGLVDDMAITDVLTAVRVGAACARSTVAVRGAFRNLVHVWCDAPPAGPHGAAPCRVFVRLTPMTWSPPDAEPRIARALRLSAAEARIAVRLARGENLDEMADCLGVSPSTVRTQLKSIFAKTATGRQAELAALVVRLLEPGGRRRF